MLPNLLQVERAVCINLEHRTDRWAQCQAEFRRWGLAVERVSPSYHTNPETSRCLTQAAILDKARRDGLHRILVLEDDVQFIGLETLTEPPPFDLCYLGFTCHLQPNTSEAQLFDRHWLRLIRACHGCYAIVWPRHVFDEAIAGLCHSKLPIDMWLANTFQPRGQVYAAHPPVAFVRDSPSDISAEPYRQFGRSLTLGQYNTAAARNGWKPIVDN